MAEIPHSTLAAYLETDYRVSAKTPFVLRIGVASAPLAKLYRQRKTGCAAFVTACNPYGRDIGAAANAARQAELESELQHLGLHYLEGTGEHPKGGWPAEPSFLVLELALEDARALGCRYAQNAIVWCAADAVPQLVLLR
jgi:hypothetical protein